MRSAHATCRSFEALALLDASGELGRFRRIWLGRHCARCPACAEYRRSIPDWESAAREALDIGDTGKNAVERVLRSLPSREATGHPRRISGRARLWKPAFAGLVLLLAAAALLLFQPAGRLRPADSAWSTASEWTEMDTWRLEIELLDSSVHALQRDFFNGQDPVRDPAMDEVDDLARELMILEEILG